jgi:hypothetical protein
LKNEPIAAKLTEKHIQDNNLHTIIFLRNWSALSLPSLPSYVGASPDRLTQCDCCGRCVLYPSTLEGKDIEQRVKTDKSFFLQINPETEEIYLVEKPDSYFQLQLQLYVTGNRKGIFSVYNGAGEIKLVFIERDEDLISTMVAKSKLFFLLEMLPNRGGCTTLSNCLVLPFSLFPSLLVLSMSPPLIIVFYVCVV